MVVLNGLKLKLKKKNYMILKGKIISLAVLLLYYYFIKMPRKMRVLSETKSKEIKYLLDTYSSLIKRTHEFLSQCFIEKHVNYINKLFDYLFFYYFLRPVPLSRSDC